MELHCNFTRAMQVMTTEVVTAKEPVSLEEANALLKSSKKGKLPVINTEGKVRTACMHACSVQCRCL